MLHAYSQMHSKPETCNYRDREVSAITGCYTKPLCAALPVLHETLSAVEVVDRASCRTDGVKQNSFGQSLLKTAKCRCPWLLLMSIGWIQHRCSTALITLSSAAGRLTDSTSHTLAQASDSCSHRHRELAALIGCCPKRLCATSPVLQARLWQQQ